MNEIFCQVAAVISDMDAQKNLRRRRVRGPFTRPLSPQLGQLGFKIVMVGLQ